MGKKVNMPIWIADDGKRFKTETAMNAHEASQKYETHVKSYVDSIEFDPAMNDRAKTAQRTRITGIVLAYLGWADQGEDDEEAAAG